VGELMADRKKKMAAAIAAVNAYLQQEQEAVAQQAAAMTVPASTVADIGVSQWSFSGRQEMMAMRRLVQLRVFDRFR
jgi:hypothetical protein